ncbi:CopG family ribbon-helix-helix protein [Acidovorax cavernicola]|uniref:DUF1778 domain-containing protein n=1 Tax=Acidovorax cavernicola TaxID=1675792 RepID=A0A9X8CZB3_9BURK|nr:DUF1778 domain-containing protein [Acidovorax cavernicola]RIX72865.1 DUF1778 domain-containing protein [Acidovorax cavernicola]
MSTTTIRIEDDLKERIANAATRAGKTSHAFILEAISETVQRVEMEEELQRLADQRWTKLVQTGKSIAWDDARTYLQARAKGDKPRKPAARNPAR